MDTEFWDKEIETMPVEKIRELQWDRMKRIVDYAYNNAAFYKNMYDCAGITPADIKTWDDFRKLPTFAKPDMRADIEKNPPYSSLLAMDTKEINFISNSSGTTGQPMISPYCKEEFETIVDVSARMFYAQGLRKEDVYMHCLNLSLFVASPSILSVQRIGAATVWAGILPHERLLQMAQAVGATTLLTTPSFAWRFGVKLKNEGYDLQKDFKIKRFIVAGEPGGCILETQRALREVWGQDLQIGEVYGLSEAFACLAGACRVHDGLHIAEDHILIEIIDPETGKEVPDGERGEIVVTALTKYCRPMIRYRTGDIGWIDRSICECGRTHARIHVVGRRDDMFIVSGVNVFPSDIEGVIRHMPELNGEFAIHLQSDRLSTSYTVDVERNPACTLSYDEIALKLKKLLKKILIAAPKAVNVFEDNTLPRTEMKAKRIIDERH